MFGLTWRMSKEVLGLALLTIADAAAFWSANNPSFMTTRSFTTAGGNKAKTIRTDITIGGVKAVIETVLIGLGAALITQSWWPLVLPVAYMAVQWGFFAWALNNPHGHTDGIGAQ